MPPSDIPDIGPFRADLHAGTGGKGAGNTRDLRRAVSGLGGVTLRAEPTWADSSIKAPARTDPDQGVLSGGRGHPSGGGRADGCDLRPARGRGDTEGPRFDLTVPPDGYAWWYVDGISADGTRAISIIAFIGSVFSPWYRWSGRRDPHNHVCINVATYGPGGRFTMTDRGRSALRQTEATFTVGPSSLNWDGQRLTINIDEWAAPPLPGKVRGTVTLTPAAVTKDELPLTADGAHVWRPFAPVSNIAVDLEAKGWSWDGHGYFDANFGTRALEADFDYWTWGRFPTRDGSVCFYDATRRDGSELAAAIGFDPDGTARSVSAPPNTRFRSNIWGIRRETRADEGVTPKTVKSMLEAPFYSRSMVKTQVHGEETVGVHEALDLRRLRMPGIMPMLACRVPRRPGWTFGG